MALTEFLLARIAEDEAVARSAAPGGWSYGDVDSVAGGVIYDESVTLASMFYDVHPGDVRALGVRKDVPEAQADATAAHIVRHDPARVLAECESKRRIVQVHIDADDPDASVDPDYWQGTSHLDTVLQLLALPYSGHEAYDESWRPA